MIKNILFIMADQLRFDYPGRYGHPSIRAPNIDALAEKEIVAISPGYSHSGRPGGRNRRSRSAQQSA